MRIALVSQEYPPETAHGGIATQTHTKAHHLAALGHRVHVISHSVDGQRREYQDGTVQVTRIAGFDSELQINTEPARWLTYSARVAAEVDALHARVSLDLVDFPEWAAEGFVYLLNRTPWHRVPVVIHLHGPLMMLANTIGWPEQDSELFRVGTMMEGTCVRLADAVMSSSRCSAAWCERHYGVDGGSIPVIHSGVDTAVFVPRAAHHKCENPTILFVGRVAASKGVSTLVDAVGRLIGEFPGLRLRLIGRVDESYAAKLQVQAQVLGLAQVLEMRGAVPHERLAEEYAAAQVFAAPSRYEGGPGFVYLEAMACGLPVVACAGSGVAEVVEHGRTGLLVPPDDPAALALALRTLLCDANARQSMGRRARAFVLAEADSHVCAQRLASFYGRIAEAAT